MYGARLRMDEYTVEWECFLIRISEARSVNISVVPAGRDYFIAPPNVTIFLFLTFFNSYDISYILKYHPKH